MNKFNTIFTRLWKIKEGEQKMDIIIIYLLVLIIPAIASLNLNSNYKKFKKIKLNKKIS